MRLEFTPDCKCRCSVLDLPKPSIRTLGVINMLSQGPEASLEIGLACALCGKPWKGKSTTTAKSLIITPEKASITQ